MKKYLPEMLFLKRYRNHNITSWCWFLLLLISPVLLKAQAYKWGNVSVGGGGFVSAIITSPAEEGLVYARTDVGGAYRWDETNQEWIPLLDWVDESQTSYLGVESLAIDPASPNRLYMLVGIPYFNGGKTAILRSDDYGQTFSITDVTAQFKTNGNGMGRQNGEKLVIDASSPNVLYAGTRWNGLFKSSDFGVSWTRVDALEVTTTPNENGISFVLPDSLSSPSGTPSQTIYAGISRTGENLYRSDDGGKTFSPVTGGPAGLMPQRAVLDNTGNMYITFANGAGPHPHWAVPEPMDKGKLMKYNTKTGEWTDITPFSNNRPYGGISIDPQNPERIITSTINTWQLQENAYGDRFYLSTNGGTTWKDIIEKGYELDENGYEWISDQSIHWAGSIEFDPFDTQKVWVTSGNGIYSTENLEATPSVWKFNVQGLEETVPLNLVSIPGGPLVSVIGDYDGFVHNDISRPAIPHKPGIGTTTGLAFAAQKPDVLLRYGDELFYSLDMGVSWTKTNSKGKKGQVAISADGEVFLHSPEGTTNTFWSADRGAGWQNVSGLNIGSARPVADPVNSNKFYAYNPANGKLYISTNKGTSFTEAGAPGTGGSKVIRTVPGHEGHLWIALYNGGLARSTDSGKSFTTIGGIEAAGAVGLGKAAPGSNYPALYIWGTINGQTGMYRSTDEGENWTRINDDAHEFGGPGNGQFILGDMNNFGRVFMSTAGRGIIYGTPDCNFSAILPRMKKEGEDWQQVNILEVQQGETVLISPEPDEAGSWSWEGPQDFSSESREIRFENIQDSEAGTYTAWFTNESGCTSPAYHFTVKVKDGPVTGLRGKETNQTLLVFPNPSDGQIMIELPDNNFKELLVKDLNGRTILRVKPAAQNKTITLRLQIPKGIYLLQLRNHDSTLSSRIIIK